MHRFDQIEPSARLWFGRGLFIYALGNLLLFTGIGFAVASFFQFALSEDWKVCVVARACLAHHDDRIRTCETSC